MRGNSRTRRAIRAAGPTVGAAFSGLLLAVVLTSGARADGCPNEAIRIQQGAAALSLSDCRAFELASPSSSPHLSSSGGVSDMGKVAPGGNAVAYTARYPSPSYSVSNKVWLARRSETGWAVEPAEPQMTPNISTFGQCESGLALSGDLRSSLLSAGLDLDEVPGADGRCGLPMFELVPGEPRGYANLYLKDEEGSYRLVNDLSAPGNATFQAASEDMTRIVFSSRANLEPGDPAGHKLYIWANGVVRHVGILPNGDRVPALLAAATRNLDGTGGATVGRAPVHNAVSADGERIVFEHEGKLYLRENAGKPAGTSANCLTSEPGKACTLQLDKSFGAGEDGGGVFLFASSDGAKVFFLSDHALTFPASAQPGRPDLYQYDVATRKLTNLTQSSPVPANVRGVAGWSADGSQVYFVARAVLTGTEENEHGETAQAGEPNLYLARAGTITYVATLMPWDPDSEGADRDNWWATTAASGVRRVLSTAWSASGRYLVLSSYKALTGSDNVPAEPGPGVCGNRPTCRELFLYDAVVGSLTCISCRPHGLKPIANTTPPIERYELARFGIGPAYIPKSVLDDGRVFFETETPLAPADVNGAADVYEYHDGEIRLITSGKAIGGAAFFDATPDGKSVFFITPESLVGWDIDGGRPSLYVARVNGGFSEPQLPVSPCDSDAACRPGPSNAPVGAGIPATTSFEGSGNLRRRACKGGKLRQNGRCVQKKAVRKRKAESHRRCSVKAKNGRKIRRPCSRKQGRRRGMGRETRRGAR